MKTTEDMRYTHQTPTFPFYAGNELPPGVTVAGYNRAVRRYAKEHRVTLEEAFAAIYGGKESTK